MQEGLTPAILALILHSETFDSPADIPFRVF